MILTGCMLTFWILQWLMSPELFDVAMINFWLAVLAIRWRMK